MRGFSLALVFALLPAFADAQPGCRTRVFPEPPAADWGKPTTVLGAENVMATPPSAAELWGHLTYPFDYAFPPTAVSVGLEYFTAEVPSWMGDTLTRWQMDDGTGKPLRFDPATRYVWALRLSDGWGGAIPWQPRGIVFEGYHLLDLKRGPNNEEATWGFRATQHFGEAHSGPLSIVLQKGEGWNVAANNLRYVGYSVLTHIQLTLRECYTPGTEPGGR